MKNTFLNCKLLLTLPLLGLLAGCCCAGGGSRRPPPQASQKKASFEVPEGATVYVAPVASSILRVAVMPFQASTELIGVTASDLFVTELLRTGRYQLVERSQLSGVLSEAEVSLSGLTEARAIELGHMLGADGVIIGSVDEYGTMAVKGKSLAVVGLSVRLIDCNSGRVMWSASLSECSKYARTPLSSHARTVVRRSVMILKQQWKVQPYVERGSATPARDRSGTKVSW
jgi:curli biogenesis system outer membrane secretion channel CsgG